MKGSGSMLNTTTAMPKNLVKYYEGIDSEEIALYEKLLTKRISQFSDFDISKLISISVEHFSETFKGDEYNQSFKGFVQDYIWILNEFKVAYEKRDLATLSELSLITEAMMGDLYKAAEHRFDK